MNKQIKIVPGTIEDFEFLPGFDFVGGKTFAKAVFYIKECGHVTFSVVGEIPEGDESESGPLRYSEGDLILTRHNTGDCPHKILKIEPHFVEGERRIPVCLGVSRDFHME